MREKIARFMQGRYGADEFSRFLIGVSFVLLILEMLTRNVVFGVLFWLVFVYCYFRIFSRQFVKRQQENQKYLTLRYQAKTKWYHLTHGKGLNFDSMKRNMEERKRYHIYKCPNCKQKIRIPRGKGKIAVRCPKCQTEFIKHS